MHILFAGNQGGIPVIEFNLALAKALGDLDDDIRTDFVIWLDAEAELIRASDRPVGEIYTLETFMREDRFETGPEVERLVVDYPQVNWSAVMASERSFVDASFLLGGAGHREESAAYVQRLLVRMVRFFEHYFTAARPDALICQTADSLFTHVLFKVAHHFGVPVFAVTPAWLHEHGKSGCFFTNDEFLGCREMEENYRHLLERPLSDRECDRAEAFRRVIINFDGNKAFYAATKRNFGRSPLSPNWRRAFGYLAANRRIDKNIDYRRFDAMAKISANIMRLWRYRQCSRFLARQNAPIPEKSVFFAMHFQPEQSTLVGGIMHANQVALVETIAKSLPFGFTLVVKEHPAGRGARPVWQYRHMASFPNVQFSDLPSKEIAASCNAVVTINGTIAVEAMALDKPVIMLGHSFFDYADVLYRTPHADELPEILRRILVDRDYEQIENRKTRIDKFLISYLEALLPNYPTVENVGAIAASLLPRIKKAVTLTPDAQRKTMATENHA